MGDRPNSDPPIRADESSGDFNVKGGDVANVAKITNDRQDFRIVTNGTGSDVVAIYDAFDDDKIVTWTEDTGRMELKKGILDLNGGNVAGCGDLFFDSSFANLRTAGGGGDQIQIADSNNGGQIVRFEEGGDVELRKMGSGGGGSLELGTSGAEIRVNGSGEVEVVDESGNVTVIS